MHKFNKAEMARFRAASYSVRIRSSSKKSGDVVSPLTMSPSAKTDFNAGKTPVVQQIRTRFPALMVSVNKAPHAFFRRTAYANWSGMGSSGVAIAVNKSVKVFVGLIILDSNSSTFRFVSALMSSQLTTPLGFDGSALAAVAEVESGVRRAPVRGLEKNGAGDVETVTTPS